MKQYKTVYVLRHFHNVGDENTYDIKMLGLYSSVKQAQNAISRYKELSGFSEEPSGFQMDKYTIDEDVDNTNGFNFMEYTGSINKQNKLLYVLWHEHENDTDNDTSTVRLLGVYSSEDYAEKAKDKYQKQRGFSSFPEEFCIDKYMIDSDAGWLTGYYSWRKKEEL